jgi:hypothetical protein
MKYFGVFSIVIKIYYLYNLKVKIVWVYRLFKLTLTEKRNKISYKTHVLPD